MVARHRRGDSDDWRSIDPNLLPLLVGDALGILLVVGYVLFTGNYP